MHTPVRLEAQVARKGDKLRYACKTLALSDTKAVTQPSDNMKTTSLLFTLMVTLAFSSFASGADQPKESKARPVVKEKKAKAEQSEKVLLTGSHIKQEVRRNGRITDGASQVVVIDRATIERSGASDLKQLLIHTGVR